MASNPAPTLRFPDDEAYRCLRSGELDSYRKLVADRDKVDFSYTDLRGVDLRKVDVGNLILHHSYLRDADLRGLDLREVDLEGCSLFHAKISGVYFASDFSADEIRMSVEYGTRLRTEM